MDPALPPPLSLTSFYHTAHAHSQDSSLAVARSPAVSKVGLRGADALTPVERTRHANAFLLTMEQWNHSAHNVSRVEPDKASARLSVPSIFAWQTASKLDLVKGGHASCQGQACWTLPATMVWWQAMILCLPFLKANNTTRMSNAHHTQCKDTSDKAGQNFEAMIHSVGAA